MMFIVTAKLTRAKLIAAVAAVAVVIAVIILLAGALSSQAASASESVMANKSIKTNDERLAYLSGYGWVVEPDPVSTQEVLIPKEFDEVYERYNEIQRSQSMDLSKYAGKRVKRYTYKITNYPTGQEDIYANLLVYKDTVIGGDVMSPELDGFMHGLAKP